MSNRGLLAAGIVAIAFLATLAVTNTFRWSRAEHALRLRTDSADVRTGQLTAEVFAAEAREAAVRDSIALLRRERSIWQARAGAERLKSDSLWSFALHMDSIAVPKSLVVTLVGSLHAQMALMDSVIFVQSVEIEHWAQMYTSADSGRAALFDALAAQRMLTKAWQAAAKPPLFSLRRLRVGPGCAAGLGGLACGFAVSYAF